MLNIKFDFDSANVVADRVDRAVRGPSLRQAAMRAVNAVAARQETAALAGASAGINLSPAYVKSKTDLAVASGNSGPVRAEILTRGDLTVMGRYPITQLTAVSKRRSSGDPSRGIVSGERASGLRVAIKKFAGAYSRQWFTMPLRRGTEAGNLLGVFYRPRGGKAQHRYAVSPYSLMRYQHTSREEQIQADLAATGETLLRQVLQQELG